MITLRKFYWDNRTISPLTLDWLLIFLWKFGLFSTKFRSYTIYCWVSPSFTFIDSKFDFFLTYILLIRNIISISYNKVHSFFLWAIRSLKRFLTQNLFIFLLKTTCSFRKNLFFYKLFFLNDIIILKLLIYLAIIRIRN